MGRLITLSPKKLELPFDDDLSYVPKQYTAIVYPETGCLSVPGFLEDIHNKPAIGGSHGFAQISNEDFQYVMEHCRPYMVRKSLGVLNPRLMILLRDNWRGTAIIHLFSAATD